MRYAEVIIGLVLTLLSLLSLSQPLIRYDWMAHADMGGLFPRQIPFDEYEWQQWCVRAVESVILALGIWLLYDAIKRCVRHARKSAGVDLRKAQP